MEQLIIMIDKELKKEFQIKTVLENTNMTKVLIELIKKYIRG